MELKEFVGLRAENERQLAQLLDEVPLDSIYYHTHGFLLRPRLLAGAYPNDFATWVDVQVRDRVLGERLAMVDPADFTTLQALREELVSVVDEHLRRIGIVPQVVYGDPFEFIQSRIVEIPVGLEVRSRSSATPSSRSTRAPSTSISSITAPARPRTQRLRRLARRPGIAELTARVQTVNPYAGISAARARSSRSSTRLSRASGPMTSQAEDRPTSTRLEDVPGGRRRAAPINLLLKLPSSSRGGASST